VSGDLLLSYYGDDFTGSTDSMEVLSLGGVPAVLFLKPPTRALLAAFPEARAVGFAGTSRSESPDWMDRELPGIFAGLRALGAPICHYKTCSTFDSAPGVGSIGRAIDIGQATFGGRFVPLVIGAPALKRYTAFGNLFAGFEGAIYRIDRHPVMRDHPVTPMDEGDMTRHLARQTARRIGLLDLISLRGPAPAAALDAVVAGGAEIVLLDVLEEADLARAGELIWARRGTEAAFVAGSSGVEYALMAHWRAAGALPAPAPIAEAGPVARLAAVSGSCSPVTEKQLRHAMSHGFEGIAVDARALAEPGSAEAAREAAIASGRAALQAGRSVVVYSALGRDGGFVETRGAEAIGFNRNLGEQLGAILRVLVTQEKLTRALVAGGDTSSHAARQLGLSALTLATPIAPGSPLCRGHAPGGALDGLEIALKGGQVGGATYFRQVLDGTA
jgi:uncharacterized protein YgbK (DUF1537 family)